MLANPVGGVKQTTIYGEAYQIKGRGLSRSALGNFLVVGNIEALPGARLNDLRFSRNSSIASCRCASPRLLSMTKASFTTANTD